MAGATGHGSAARGRARRLLAFAEDHVTTRRGLLVLFGVALVVYALQSALLPLQAGRDLGTYLRYYAQMWHEGSALPMSMLVRTPVAPVVAGGVLDFGGGYAAQALLAVLYGGWLVAWTSLAAIYGRRTALAVAAVLLVFPAYGILFHRLSTDVLFTFAFALWALLIARSLLHPSVLRFAVIGLGIGLLTLIRPGNQTLLVVALFPLFLRRPWRTRVLLAVAVPVCALAVLGPYTVYNGLRYGDYTIARGANAVSPFYRVYVIDRIVSPENGPASRELAAAVERDLLPLEPYRSRGVTVEQFFARGSARTWEDLVNLSDRIWGWDSDYAKLREVAFEAIRKHPGTYARSVFEGFLATLWKPEYYIPDGARRAAADGGGGTEGTGLVDAGPGDGYDGELVPAARMGLYSTTPDGSIREVWTSPTAHRIVFRDPAQKERFDRMNADVARLSAKLPPYDGSQTMVLWFNRASRWFPRPLLWLVAGCALVAWRRPRRIGVALALTVAGLFLTATVGLGNAEYALPAAPVFVVLVAAGLFGARRRAAPQQATAPGSG